MAGCCIGCAFVYAPYPMAVQSRFSKLEISFSDTQGSFFLALCIGISAQSAAGIQSGMLVSGFLFLLAGAQKQGQFHGENLIDNADFRLLRRHKTAHLGHQHDEGGLA